MLYGRIKDFYVASTGAQLSVVKFLVALDELETSDSFTICAEIPNDALKFKMIKAGAVIGCQHMEVFIEIEGVEDIPFKKIGKLNGNEITFYEHLKILDELKERNV